jgi:SAM-dependent methyltransferase
MKKLSTKKPEECERPADVMLGYSTLLSENQCLVCGSKRLTVFFQMLDVPVFSCAFWESRDAALNCPRGDIRLAFCPVCSYIMNVAYEPALVKYTQAYENSLFFSTRFRMYARSLAERLVARYDLHDKDIVSIGCGKGEFLSLLCELGKNRGVGFDPAYVEQEKHQTAKNRVKFVRDFYSERYADHHADLIVCRHVLEHVYDPKGFLTKLRHAIGNRNMQLFFEVPNALQTFRHFDWDIIYEHYSNFTPASLERVFSSSGFRVLEIAEEFEDQYLCAYAQPASQSAPHCDHEPASEVNRIESDVESFAAHYMNKVRTYGHKLDQMKEMAQRTVVWGAGSKGVMFLNTFKDSEAKYVVDINPRKHGMYIPGTGQQIVPPDFLKDYRPDTIILMNRIYRQEIQHLMKNLGLTAKFMDA